MNPTTTSDGFLLGLESLMRRTGQGRHLAVTVLECDGTPDRDRLQRAARALGHRHPLLHARLRRSLRTFQAAWHPGPAAPVPLHFHQPGGHDPLPDLIHGLLNGGSIDVRAPGPNLHLHAVTLGPDRWALLILWPHALLDAIGLDKLISELDDPDPAPRNDSGETSTVGGSPAALWRQAHPLIEEMRIFPGWRIRSLHRTGSPPGNSRIEVLRFDRGQSASIRARMAATAGELLLLPYFAACAARAVRAVIARRHPDEDVPILLSLPLQRSANPAKRPLFHNHMVACSLLLTAGELSDLPTATRSLYRKYASFLRRKLPAAMEALMRLMERCPSRLFLKPPSFYLKGEFCSLFHSHTGSFAPGIRSLFSCRLLDGWHVPSVSSPPGIGIFFSEFDSRLTCTLSWKDGSLDAEELSLLKQTLLDDLQPAPTPACQTRLTG